MLNPQGSAFPSGHAASAGATVIALVLLSRHPGWWRLRWLTDVTAGALLGAGVKLAPFECVKHRSGPGGRRG